MNHKAPKPELLFSEREKRKPSDGEASEILKEKDGNLFRNLDQKAREEEGALAEMQERFNVTEEEALRLRSELKETEKNDRKTLAFLKEKAMEQEAPRED